MTLYYLITCKYLSDYFNQRLLGNSVTQTTFLIMKQRGEPEGGILSHIHQPAQKRRPLQFCSLKLLAVSSNRPDGDRGGKSGSSTDVCFLR